MPTFSVGAISSARSRQHRRRGVTLLELMIVVALIGLIAGLSFPSVVSGIDSMRLRSSGAQVTAFLNTALDRADRRQQVMEIRIAPAENAMVARSADMKFERRLELQDPIHIRAVLPALPNSLHPGEEPRRFLVYPGGALPRIGIELATNSGRRRLVSVDPITGTSRSVTEPASGGTPIGAGR